MTKSDIIIREFKPTDLPALTELERSVYGSGAYSYYFFRQLHDLFPKLVWVAERDGALVGHVCGAIAQDGKTGWILNLAVQAHFRRQGVGGRLIKACVEHLQAGGVEAVRTTAHTENSAGIQAMLKRGFTQVAVEENYYGDGHDRLILEFRIEL